MQPEIDFVAHAASMGAHAEKAADIADLEARIVAARGRDIPSVIVIDTDAVPGTEAGGHWWDVAVPEVGGPERLERARARYDANAALAARLQLIPRPSPRPRPPPSGPSKVTDKCRSYSASLSAPTARSTRSPRLGGLALCRLLPLSTARRARPSAEATGDREVILVLVEGKAGCPGRGPGLGRAWRADGWDAAARAAALRAVDGRDRADARGRQRGRPARADRVRQLLDEVPARGRPRRSRA